MNLHAQTLFLGVLAVLTLAAPAAGQDRGGGRTEAAVTAADENVVRPGDAIRVRVFRTPSPEARLFEDLLEAGEYPVDELGFAVLPRLGRRAVGGRSVEEVRTAAATELERAYPNAVVEITVLRRVLVHGAVRRPGSYLLASYEATVGDALSRAEGIAPQGRTNLVRVLRGDRVFDVRLGDNTRLAAITLQSGDELIVPQRSWITREPALSATILSSTVYLVVTLILVAQQRN